MEPKASLPHLQESATRPYSEPDQPKFWCFADRATQYIYLSN